MIDHEREELLTLTAATKLLPGRPNVATLWRWRTAGVRGVKLETILCGGRRMTSREALTRFFAATTAAADGALGPSGNTSPARAGDRPRRKTCGGVGRLSFSPPPFRGQQKWPPRCKRERPKLKG